MDFKDVSIQLENKYAIDKRAILFNFREVVDIKGERYTHSIHPYPAKLIPHIPLFFLANTHYSNKGDTILDPFIGAGTVSLEASLNERKSIGVDINPLACLISQVKSNYYKTELLLNESQKLLVKNSVDQFPTPDVVNLDFWFETNVSENLKNLKNNIDNISEKCIRDFYFVCFSSLLKKVSNADPRIAVPVKLKKARSKLTDIEIDTIFTSIVEQNQKRNNSLQNIKLITPNIINGNSLIEMQNIKTDTIKMIITSPPYPGAQKYIRSSFLNLGWLGLSSSQNLKKLKYNTVGREEISRKDCNELLAFGNDELDKILEIIFNINKSRYGIVINYLKEMRNILVESYRVLMKGGHLVLIVGNGFICKQDFQTQKYLTDIAISIGFKIKYSLIDDIKSYGLMTKRNKTANVISSEYVNVFIKE